MKITLLLLFVFATTLCTAQYRVEYGRNGLSPKFVVVQTDSLSQQELYTKTINWIKETYANPDEVINATIDNEMVRFSGSRENAMATNSLGIRSYVDVRYTITIEFKEGRYKFEPESMEYYTPPSQYVVGGWTPILFSTGSAYYRENGKERTIFADFLIQIPVILNELIYSHGKYLSKKSAVEKSDW